MRVLVTFAVDAEFAPWRKRRTFKKIARAGMDCYDAGISGATVTVLLTGIGAKRNWVEATKVVWDGDVDFCISSGLAGGLRPEHIAGEVLVAEEVVDEHFAGVACDTGLIALAEKSGAKRVGSFYSGAKVVLHAKEKKDLGARADAVEMESHEVLEEAKAFGARVVAVRAISDTVGEDLPVDFNLVTTEEGDVSLAKVVGQIARKPGLIGPLMQFGKQSRMAAENLANFLDAYVEKLIQQAKVASVAEAAR